MKNILVSLFAETFIHPGSGQSEGAIDLPVARERVTGYPFIAGSSLKGAWRDYATQSDWQEEKIHAAFGQPDCAGQLLIADARLLLLPVRSLNHSYCWVTCPLLLQRLARDISRLNKTTVNAPFTPTIDISQGQYQGTVNDKHLFLEERCFERANGTTLDETITNTLKDLLPEMVANRLDEQLVILNDTDFNWFTRNALTIQARNVLDDDTKQSKNLWYEETLPPDTLMTTQIAQRHAPIKANQMASLAEIKIRIAEHSYLQVGGNETVGQGWFKLSIYPHSPKETAA